MKWTVRLRLTLLYSALFLVTGMFLIALIYLLVAHSSFPGPPAAPRLPGLGDLAVPQTQMEEQRAADLSRLLVSSLVALTVMAFVSMVLGWLMAGRVLRPVAAAFVAQRRFVANASHELRTPLTLQRATAEVALADPDADAESMRAALLSVLAAGQSQERLIEALLSLARGQQGPHRRQNLDLADLTRDALDERQGIEATLRPAPLSGDRDLVEQLVANLLDNALRHNVPGGWVTVATAVAAGRSVLVVANSGPVIPADQVSLLFQPFQRLGTGRRATGDGLGLGLSIVEAVVEAHHGTIDARPLPEGGLRVTVAF